MNKLSIKLTILVFLLALLSGFYLDLPILQNLIRASVIYLIFSVLILLIFTMYNQSTYNMLKAQLEQNDGSHQEDIVNQDKGKTE